MDPQDSAPLAAALPPSFWDSVPAFLFDPLFLLGILLILGVFVIWFVESRARTARHLATLRATELAALENVLATSSDGYFLWTKDPDGQDRARCSRRLAVLLDLANGERATFDDLLARLLPPDALSLESALGALRSDGRGFRLDVREGVGNRRLRAMGVAIGVPQKSTHDAALWIRDITSEEFHREDLKARADDLLVERNRLRAMLNALPTPVWARDGELTLTDCNQTFARALDVPSPQEAIKSGRELLEAPGSQELRALAARSRSGKGPVRARFHAVLDGERRLLDVTEIPLPDDSLLTGTTVGQAIDITAIEDVENRLENQIEANAEILERLNSGIALFGQDTHLHFFNRAFARLWKVDPAWLATSPGYGDVLERLRESRHLPEVADFPAYKSAELGMFTRLMRPREDILHLPDGGTLRRVIAPHPLGGLIVTTEDVTDSLALERAHTQLAAVFDETLTNLQEGMAIFDATGLIRQASPSFPVLTGLRAPVRGLGTIAFLENMQQKIRSAADAQQFRTFLNARRGEASLMLRSGRILAYRITPLSDGGWMITVR